MEVNRIVAIVNELLAGERHSLNQIITHLDRAIDDINQALNSKYPVFSEMPEGKVEYDYFPDRYIRSVVCIGAAWHYFSTDEEGNPSAEQYAVDFDNGIYLMVRDYFTLVPIAYQEGVYVDEEGVPHSMDAKAFLTPHSIREGERGLDIDVQQIFPI